MYSHEFCSYLPLGKRLLVVCFISKVCIYKGEGKEKGVTDYMFPPQVSTSIGLWTAEQSLGGWGWVFPSGGAFPHTQINFKNLLINLPAAKVTDVLNLNWQLLNRLKVQVLLIILKLCLSELCASGNKAHNSIWAGLNQASKPFIMHILKPLQGFKQTYLFWTVSITSS